MPESQNMTNNSKSMSDTVSSNTLSTNLEHEPVVFKKQLSLLNVVTLTIGGMIGSGIFVSPKGVLQHVGSVGLSLIVWILCGVLTAIGGTCYAELGTSILESGGEYTYVRRAYGELPGFLYMWTTLCVSVPCNVAVGALVFAEYVVKPVFIDCAPPQMASLMIAASVIVLITAINCYSIKLALRVQDLFTFTKMLAVVVVIVAGIVHVAGGHTANLRWESAFENSKTDLGPIVLAIYSGLWAYNGSSAVAFVTEEIKKPEKNVPRGICISITLVTVVYVLANMAYFAVLPTYDILESSAVGVTFAVKMLGVMQWTIPLFIASSMFGNLTTGIFVHARVLVAAARHGMLPAIFGMLNTKYLTPVPTLIFNCATSLVMVSFADVYTLMFFVVFVEAIFNASVASTIFYFRWKLPSINRPFKPPLVLPILYVAICVILVALPLVYSPIASFTGVGITLIGVPVYLICVKWTTKPKLVNDCLESVTHALQKVLLCVKEEGEFE